MISVVMTAAMLAGCGGGGTDADASSGAGAERAQSAETEKTDNTLRYVIGSELVTIDPTMNNYAASSNLLLNLFNGLYRFNEDGTNVEPACAERYEVSDDGLVYTFRLREGLKWSDGTPLTAKDFEYSWKRELAQELASPAAWNLFDIKNAEAYNSGEASVDEVGVKALDDLTLEVTLEHPTAYFVSLTAGSNWAPVKQEAVEGSETWTKSADTYVCNGPFMMEEIKPQEAYVIRKNPNYWDVENVQLERAEFVIIEQAEAALSAYNAGEIDVLSGASVGTQAFAQYGDSAELSTHDLIGTSYWDFNCEKEYLTANVRKALSMAIDREIINENAVPSRPKSAYAFVPYGIPYGDEPENFRDVVGEKLFTEDVEAARTLLADAGYPDGQGLPTLQLIISNTQENKDKAQMIQAMWKENLGVNSEIVTYESKVYWTEHGAGNFDVAFDGYTGDYLDPNATLTIFRKARMEKECRWRSEGAAEYNTLLEQAASEADNAKRMEIFTRCEEILMNEMPIIPQYYRNTAVLTKPYVKGFTVDFGGHPLLRCVSIAE